MQGEKKESNIHNLHDDLLYKDKLNYGWWLIAMRTRGFLMADAEDTCVVAAVDD